MATRVMRVVNLGVKHPSHYWPAARAGYWYPAVEPTFTRPNKGVKVTVKYTKKMIEDLRRMQIDDSAAKALFKINGGYFNVSGNKDLIKLPWPFKSYVPFDAKKAVAQGVTSAGNLVKVLQVKGQWTKIATFRPGAKTSALDAMNRPWMYCTFTSVQVGTGVLGNACDDRGVIFPLYSKTGEAWIPTNHLEKP